MEWLQWAPHAVVAVFLGGVIWAVVISQLPNALPWRRRREQFLELAEKRGFEVERERCTVSKNVDTLSLRAGILTVRQKRCSIKLWGQLSLPDAPEGLFISTEGSLAGVARALGAKERTVGSADFDAVFWLTCPSEEEMREYLTPEKQQAFLYWLPRIPGARICDKKVTAEVIFSLPTFMAANFEPLLGGLERLAQSLQGKPNPCEKDAASPGLELMQKKFARGTLGVWGVLSAASLALDSQGPMPYLVGGGSFVMLLLTLGLYRGLSGCRVLLQGLYAFLSLAGVSLLLVGGLEAAEILSSRWLQLKEDEILPFALLTSVVTLYFWGCRHHLKILGTSVSKSRGV